MKLSIQEDINAPIDFVYARMTDIDYLERLALKSGALVHRLDDSTEFKAGARWRIEAEIRNKNRRGKFYVREVNAPSEILCESETKNFNAIINVSLISLGKIETRLSVKSEIKPENLSGKLLLHSFRLVSGAAKKRMAKGLGKWGTHIEEEYRNESLA